ncbi:hypothetical protein [Mycolicibacterium sarraceniae]|nr:hypothetical protein [Mycolicibacterium sarraceniae]
MAFICRKRHWTGWGVAAAQGWVDTVDEPHARLFEAMREFCDRVVDAC